MKYFSTRGGEELLSFEEVSSGQKSTCAAVSSTVIQTVLTGLAPDGGLYIPEAIPRLPEHWQTEWAKHSFVDLSIEVLSLYISPTEISRAELRALVEKSYSTFRHPDITPLHRLNDKTFVLELFHGPTFAFKDVALQLLGNLFEFFLTRRNARKGRSEKPESLTVVGATSGDTGRYVTHTALPGCCMPTGGPTVQQSMASEIRPIFPSLSCTRRVEFRLFKRPR